ncbi:MAG: DUF998 domain-containing protein [Thermoplasmata archaeon]|nr:DUF998 domain-containing protein [Thermoplasmata archaeon]
MANTGRTVIIVAALFIVLGIAMPFSFAAAIIADGFWTFNENMLSDLGVSYNQTSAYIFNFTCVFSGILIALLGLWKTLASSNLDRKTGIPFMISGLFLCGVGIFNESYQIHAYVATAYFVMLSVTIFMTLVSDVSKRKKVTVAATVLAITIVLLSVPEFNKSGIEVIGSMCACAWLIIQGISMVVNRE